MAPETAALSYAIGVPRLGRRPPISGNVVRSHMTTHDEDRRLGELGYTQRLSRSVGGLSSFLLGFAVISATTAVFSGFGYGLATAGPAFVWTFPIALVIFFLWASTLR